MRLQDGVRGDAVFSDDEVYRYVLRREWDPSSTVALFVMLNPSTAAADVDDPTVRKCQWYARSWGFGGIIVANLFAIRATDPKVMLAHPAPEGPLNDAHIDRLANHDWTDLIVAAWGAHGAHRNAGIRTLRILAGSGKPVMRLGPPTKGGHPRHPLYLPNDITLEPHR